MLERRSRGARRDVERVEKPTQVRREGTNGSAQVTVSPGRLALNGICEGSEASRIGESSCGQPKCDRPRVASSQYESGGENVGELRYRCDCRVVLRRRAEKDMGAEKAVKAGDAGHGPWIGAVRADGDRATAPEIRPGGVVTAGRAPKHRMRSDEGDARTNARPRGLDDGLLHARDVAEDRAVAHERGNSPEQPDRLRHGRSQDDDLAPREVGGGSGRYAVEQSVSPRGGARCGAGLDSDQNLSGKSPPDRLGERSSDEPDPDDADRACPVSSRSPACPGAGSRTTHSRPTARAIAPTSCIVSASIGSVND
jgi:hypothetical protein